MIPIHTAPGELALNLTLPSLTADLRWVKSQKSVASSACVELLCLDGMILVRDSKNPHDPPLRYTWAEMDAFFDGVKRGEFDVLLDAVKDGQMDRIESPALG